MEPATPQLATALAVHAHQLTKRYGDLVAVDQLDLQVPAGQFFGLLGPNGSGKTSTINMLATLIRPSAGQAVVAGHDVANEPVRVRGKIGLVFQDSALDRTLSVWENLRFAGMLYSLSEREIEARVSELLQLFDLQERRNAPVGALSGGMRRALDIARGVIHHPQVLFLDEPTTGLDLPNRRKIWRFIARLRQKLGMTVVLTTHYLEEAEDADQVAFIKKGKIVARGVPRTMISDLGHSIVEVEGEDLSALAEAIAPKLGKPLIDADTAFFRVQDEIAHLTAWLEDEFGSRLSAVRVRKPNLNDVFLWVTQR